MIKAMLFTMAFIIQHALFLHAQAPRFGRPRTAGHVAPLPPPMVRWKTHHARSRECTNSDKKNEITVFFWGVLTGVFINHPP